MRRLFNNRDVNIIVSQLNAIAFKQAYSLGNLYEEQLSG